MDITADFLRHELEAMEQRRAQQVADLNVTDGALQVLRQLVAKAEERPVSIAELAKERTGTA